MSHTPGPWSFRIWAHDESPESLQAIGLTPVPMLSNDGQRFIMAEKGRVAVVDCQSDYKRGKGYQAECAERDANASLIAAAPDLLEFVQEELRKFVAPGRTDSPHEEKMRLLIEKATGVKP